MFLQLKKLNNESGIILFVVLMIAIVIMIFSVGILTQSRNENNYTQQQIDQIVSDQLAKGIFWNEYSNSYSAGNVTAMQGATYSSVIGGRSYQVTLVPAGGTKYSVVTNYDSSQ